METLKDEVESVQNLFDWEKQTLKEANPNWKDPDEYELPEPEVKQDKKAEQSSKTIKKSGKKI